MIRPNSRLLIGAKLIVLTCLSVLRTFSGTFASAQIIQYANSNFTQVNDADGKQIDPTFDPPISDTSGNSVIHTLDLMGNRIGEQVQDASGLLVQQVSRAFDVLGRVKQVTGAMQ